MREMKMMQTKGPKMLLGWKYIIKCWEYEIVKEQVFATEMVETLEEYLENGKNTAWK